MGIRDTIREKLLDWLTEGDKVTILTTEEQKQEHAVKTARDYYLGTHPVKLTERQKEFLDLHSGADIEFTVNHCRTVVDAVVERLKLNGFNTADDSDEDVQNELERWARINRLDAFQMHTHRKAVIDGESFVLVDWDEESGAPKFVLHPRFVSSEAGGNDYGMWIDYRNGDPMREPLRAVKRWNEKNEDGELRRRKTVYYPDRIERYAMEPDSKDWEPFPLEVARVEVDEEGNETTVTESEPWPVPWVDQSGDPLGIPIIHFRNTHGQSELRDIIPLQDALNKSWLDIVAAADTTSFRMLYTLGFIPTKDGKPPEDDGSNLLEVVPGQIITTNRPPDRADIGSIDPADLSGLMELEDRIVTRIATVSDTPLARFNTSKQIASDETLKQQEGPLLSKVEERQITFGNAWEDVFRMAFRLGEVFGEGVPQLAEGDQLSAEWEPAETRNEKMLVDVALAKKKLNVTTKVLLRELGYSDEEIEEMAQDPEFRAKMDRAMLATLELNEFRNDADTGDEGGDDGGQDDG